MKERYFSFIKGRFAGQRFDHGLRIVVDPGNGAAAGLASQLLGQMGLEVIPVNDEPDGRFPGRSPEPREDTLEGTVEFLRKHDGDLAICFDGDADRVTFCDREGFLGFNEPIAFISRLAVEETGKKTVATTVETGQLLDLAVKDLGAEVVRGRVGDVAVAHLVQETDAALGVEQVGVYIMPEAGYYPDSIYASLFLLSRLRDAGEIRRFVRGLPRLYFDKARVPCANGLKESVMARVRAEGARVLAGGLPVSTVAVDGLRLEFADSWLLIRASGTEPIIRVIAESRSSERTAELMSRARDWSRTWRRVEMKAVFLCGGRGKRMFPIAEDKFLLDFLGKSLLEHQLEMARAAGLTELVIIANPDNRARIEEIAGRTAGVRIELAMQEESAGIADALKSAAPLLRGRSWSSTPTTSSPPRHIPGSWPRPLKPPPRPTSWATG
jgi:hypothetical protein